MVGDLAVEISELRTHATEELRLLPADELFESPLNPRQYYPEGPMQELVESMKASGFRPWLPLVVTPRPEGGYTIAAGHRRKRAAEIAGIDVVPCLVRVMSEPELLDVLNFDNTGREDVHPLHEAAGWKVLMERTGMTVRDIAARIGKTGKGGVSIEYVYQRLKYLELIGPAHQAFLEGKLTPGHAIQIARLDPDEQTLALRFALQTDARGDTPSVRALAEYLHGPDGIIASRAPASPPPAPEPSRAAAEPTPPPPPGPASTAAAPQRDTGETARRQEEVRRQERQEIEAERVAERKVRQRILTAALEKIKWPPTREEILYLLADHLEGLPAIGAEVAAAQGLESPAWAELRKASDSLAARLVSIVFVCGDLEDYRVASGEPCERLNMLAKRAGVDVAAIRRAARADQTGGKVSDTRKGVVGKLPVLGGTAKKPAKKKAATKKQPAKKLKKQQAAKAAKK